MTNSFSRTELMLGKDAMKKLSESRVAVFGIGGVGGHTVDALIRSGVGALDIIDGDTVSISNINRQMVATTKTLGMPKVDVAKAHCLDVNPTADVRAYQVFFLSDTADMFDFSQFDYVVDAVDTVTAKLLLIECANKAGVKIISSMGAGNKLDPTRFEVADIYDTTVCPLARIMRKECKKRGIKSLKCVYSKEPAIKPDGEIELPEGKRQLPSSNAFVPSVAGLIIAGEVIKDITGVRNDE